MIVIANDPLADLDEAEVVCDTCQNTSGCCRSRVGHDVKHIMPMATIWKLLPSPDSLTHHTTLVFFPSDMDSCQGHISGRYVEDAHWFEDALAASLNRKCL